MKKLSICIGPCLALVLAASAGCSDPTPCGEWRLKQMGEVEAKARELGACADDADCTTIQGGTSCEGDCDIAVSMAGKGDVLAAQQKISDDYCGTDDNDRCGNFAASCSERWPACTDGVCTLTDIDSKTGVCSVIGEDCGDGNCYFIGPAAGAFYCGTPGTKAVGETCGAATECVAGAQCLDIGGTMNCYQVCTEDAQCDVGGCIDTELGFSVCFESAVGDVCYSATSCVPNAACLDRDGAMTCFQVCSDTCDTGACTDTGLGFRVCVEG